MRYLIISLFIMVFLSSCTTQPDENQKFINLSAHFTEDLLKQYPQWATSLGDHRYDHRLNGYSKEEQSAELEFLYGYLDSLKTISAEKLDQVNRIDYRIMKHHLEKMIFDNTVLKELDWNPLAYNVGDPIYVLLARDFAPLKDRLINLKQRLLAVTGVLDAARANLTNPPRIYTETAILQNPGVISLVTAELNNFLAEVPELQAEFAPVQEATAAALESYGEWLKEDLLPRSNGEFRLGDEKYRKKLFYSLESDLSKEQIYTTALKELELTQQSMYETALPLYEKFFPGQSENSRNDRKLVIKSVLDKIAEEHPNNETIVEMAREKLIACTDFVKENDMVTVPDQPLQIVVMPEYQRGVAVAYCDAPGALEEKGETFYTISPTPEDWSAERSASFFREYNNYMLVNLTIHEAVPGHYLQLMHSNAFRAPTKIRAVFASGTFIEGWATYAEQIMADAGFVGPELKMQQLKMRLRLIINAMIDQKIHTEGMTEAEAMALMMDEGFQEEGEAAGKWRRACLSSAQLSTYFIGNIEINHLRQAYEQKFGPGETMRAMHDKMLSFGSPAAKYVHESLGL